MLSLHFFLKEETLRLTFSLMVMSIIMSSNSNEERKLTFVKNSVCIKGNGCELEQDPALTDNTVRFWCPELTQEGQWHHLVLIFHRAGIMKNSSVSLFVDGEHVDTQKVNVYVCIPRNVSDLVLPLWV